MRSLRVAAVTSACLIFMTLAAQAASPLLPIAETEKDEFGGVAGSVWKAWTIGGLRPKVHVDDGVSAFNITGDGIATFTGGMDGDDLIYQVVSGGGTSSDIYLYDIPTETPLATPDGLNSKWWDYKPFKSGDWVLFARNNIGYGKATEWIKILLVNTSTLEKRILASVRPSLVTPGQLTGDWAVWYRCARTGCWTYRHHIPTDTTTKLPQNTFAQYSPAVTGDGTLYFGRSKDACGGAKVVRRSPGGLEGVIHQFNAHTDVQQMYVFVDGTLEHDLYISTLNCNTGKGDVVYIDAADTATSLAPGISADHEGDGATERVDLMLDQPALQRAAP